MNTADVSHRTAAARRFLARTELLSPDRAYQAGPGRPASRMARPDPKTPQMARHAPQIAHPDLQAARPDPQAADQVWQRLHDTAPQFVLQTPRLPALQHRHDPAPRPPAVAPDSLWLSRRGSAEPAGQWWVRKQRTWPQRAGGILIAAALVVGVAWYVPRVLRADGQLLTGTVMSSGVVTLNFTDSGQIAAIDVHLGQVVQKGQVLAVESAPDVKSVVTADQAAIASDRARISELKAAAAANPASASMDNAQIAASNAQLAADEAQLAAERTKAAATQITAPAPGVVVAVNGQPGEVVTAAGIRNYVAVSQQTSATRSPSFSLLPEGPQSVREPSAGTSALPVIALRMSMTWQVVAHIPETSVSAIKPGEAVLISVPAAHIANVPGRIDEVLPTPESTSGGTVYQAVVTITGRAAGLPLNGMAADIRLGP
jgi:multidrug efflux pump subunit AcrA (membrane-fusion protein)